MATLNEAAARLAGERETCPGCGKRVTWWELRPEDRLDALYHGPRWHAKCQQAAEAERGNS